MKIWWATQRTEHMSTEKSYRSVKDVFRMPRVCFIQYQDDRIWEFYYIRNHQLQNIFTEMIIQFKKVGEWSEFIIIRISKKMDHMSDFFFKMLGLQVLTWNVRSVVLKKSFRINYKSKKSQLKTCRYGFSEVDLDSYYQDRKSENGVLHLSTDRNILK